MSGPRRLATAAPLALVAAAAIVALPTSTAVAQTFTVTTTDDGGTGSLRQAVADANTAGGTNRIVLAPGLTYQLTDCGAGALSITAGALTIEGHGSTVEQTCAGDGVIGAAGNESLTVEDTIITGGDSTGGGGGIATTADLTLTHATVTGNKAAGPGGGVQVLGGSLSLHLTDSDVTNNRSTSSGGGVAAAISTVVIAGGHISDNTAGDAGGGLWVTDATVTDTAFHHNTAGSGGGGVSISNDSTFTRVAIADNKAQGGGGIDSQFGSLTLEHSTVTGNEATTNDGGGLSMFGSATIRSSVVNNNTAALFGGGVEGDVTLRDSEVSGNRAANHAGIDASQVDIEGSTIASNQATTGVGGVFASGGPAQFPSHNRVVNSTIVLNQGGSTGGLALGAGENVGTLDLKYATVSANTGGTADNLGATPGTTMRAFATVIGAGGSAAPSCAGGAMTSDGYNFEESADTCGFGAGPGDVVDGPDPLLGTLRTSAGPTPTSTPAAGSPLVDAIPGQNPGCQGTDQRGITRPQMNGCDIGAVEVRAPVAANGSFTTKVNTSTDVDLHLFVTDPDGWLGGGSTYSVQTPPSHGTTSLPGAGVVRYRPATNYVGHDSFGYRVCPGTGSYCIAATVSGTITGTPSGGGSATSGGTGTSGSSGSSATNASFTSPATSTATPRFTG